jgi:biopolymer transport protein ExbB
MNSRRWIFPSLIVLSFFLFSDHFILAQETEALKPLINSMEQAQEGMTLWQLLKAGGLTMVVLLAMSIVAGAIVVYDFRYLTEKRLVPTGFSQDVIQKLQRKDRIAAEEMCNKEDNIISRIVLEGLAKRSRGNIFAKEAMENMARKEIGVLWQNLSYLADIAAIAPLIGLLGTVLGMIQAFNVIAFQTAVVKPILLAGGVSKAMVTTAGGLFVAIPTMMFYSYFRGRVLQITNLIENYNTDIIKFISELSN